jgi:hypothetical protein
MRQQEGVRHTINVFTEATTVDVLEWNSEIRTEAAQYLADKMKSREIGISDKKHEQLTNKEGKCGFLAYGRVLVSEFISKEKKRRAKANEEFLAAHDAEQAAS